MNRGRSRTFSAAVGVLAFATACSHDGGNGTSASPSPAASVATAAPATAAPATASSAAAATGSDASGTSVNDKRESVTKNGATSAMGVATESDLGEIGLPIYPTIALDNTFLIKHVDAHSASYRLQVSVRDPFKTVAAWYGQKLGSSFKAGHSDALGGITSFSRKTATANDSVLLQSQTDANLHVPLTTITYTVTRRR